MHPYDAIDPATRSALELDPDALRRHLGPRLDVHPDNHALIEHFAELLWTDFAAHDGPSLIIAPVGPIGQYDSLAQNVVARGQSLAGLTILIMDEYLNDHGDWIDEDDPLSFRGHMARAFAFLPDDCKPRVVTPDPHDLGQVGRLIAAHGGVSTAYAGVGITGHLAFNDPIPGVTNPDVMAGQVTRVVSLSPETRLINSVTAAHGNTLRIPRQAVTVGMAEILGAARLRIFMNRDWQCAAIRRLAAGPVIAEFPASLVQTHANWTLHAVEAVLNSPEPGLR